MQAMQAVNAIGMQTTCTVDKILLFSYKAPTQY